MRKLQLWFCFYRMITCQEKALDHMKMGLFDVLPSGSLDGLTAEDFRLLLNGVRLRKFYNQTGMNLIIMFSGGWYQCANFDQLHILQRRIWRESRPFGGYQTMAVVNCGKNVAFRKARSGLLLDGITGAASVRGRIPTDAIGDHPTGRWPAPAFS